MYIASSPEIFLTLEVFSEDIIKPEQLRQLMKKNGKITNKKGNFKNQNIQKILN